MNSRQMTGEAIQEVHLSKKILLQAERKVNGTGTELLFELSGTVQGNTAHVLGLHEIRDGVRHERDSVQVIDADAANRDLDRQLAGRNDEHIGNAHCHLPHHLQGPSSQDMANIARHAGKAHRQVYLLFQDRGNDTMGFQARDTNGNRVKVAVHDDQTGRVFWDAPDAPGWRLEDDGTFTEKTQAA